MPRRVAVFGASGQSKVVVDALRLSGHEVVGYFDRDRAPGTTWLGAPVLGSDETAVDLADRFDAAVIGIGDNHVRARVAATIERAVPDIEWIAAVHPSAVVAAGAELGAGVRLMAGAVVGPGCVLGEHSTVDTGASLDHDSTLGACASLAPGAVTGGDVRVGDGAAVGIGASVLHGVRIGAHTVVGAGAVVLRDLPDRVVAFGAPARVVRDRGSGDPYL